MADDAGLTDKQKRIQMNLEMLKEENEEDD
jgi:hypothetical protein